MIDWPRILADCIEAGVNYPELARRTGIPRTTIGNYTWRSEPSHAHGEKLIETWSEVTKKAREQVPQAFKA